MRDRRVGFAASCALLLCASSCSGRDGSKAGGPSPGKGAAHATEGAHADPADAVAQVGDQTISREEVEALMSRTGLSPREALEALVQERLLAAEALRRGYGDDPRVLREARKASAHVLLAEAVEVSAGPSDLPEAEVEQQLDETVRKRALPERRRADHILFQVGKKAAEEERAVALRGAREAVAELQQADDVDAVLESYAQMKKYAGRIRVKVESLRPIRRGGPLEQAFTEAVFEAASPGPLREPVETSYGAHAVVVREVLPPVEPDRAALANKVRERLVTKLRRERLEALLSDLQRRSPTHYDEAAITAAFQEAGPEGAP